MLWFEKHPKIRLVFAAAYIAAAVRLITKDFAWLNIVIALLFLFGGTISLAKSGLIRVARSDSVKNFSFDFISIAVIIGLLADWIGIRG